MIAELVFYSEHGVLIVEDKLSAYRHDDWNPATQPVSIGPDSLYLSVRPYVDGTITVRAASIDGGDVFDDATALLFEGILETPSGRIIIHDTDDLAQVIVRRPKGPTAVRVLVDEPASVGRMLILFSNP